MEDPSNQKDILTETTAEEAGKSGFHKRFQKPLLIIAVMMAVVFAVLIIFNVLIRPFDKTMSTYSNFTVEEGAGTRYAPYLSGLLARDEVRLDLEYLLDEGRKANYRNAYQLLRDVQSPKL